MDPALAPHFYSSSTMADYVGLPPASASTTSLFSTALPSIISIDSLNSCSAASPYNLPFPSAANALPTDLVANDTDDIWRGSSIASLRRKAVEYQAGSGHAYK